MYNPHQNHHLCFAMQVVTFTWTHPGPQPATQMGPPISNMTKINAVSINARGLQTKGVFKPSSGE